VATIGRIPENRDKPETDHQTIVRLYKELNELQSKEDILAMRFAEWTTGQAYCYLYADNKWLIEHNDMPTSEEMLTRYKATLTNE
jgi:hypothetical protein